MPEPGSEIVVHPGTGELIGQLDEQPADVLAETLLALREYQAQVRRWEHALEAELRERLKGQSRTEQIFGEYAVDAKPTYSRIWDADELEAVLRELLDQGVLAAGELTEVIRHETNVSGKEALQLLNRLQGGPRERVESCFSWQQKGSKVHVERAQTSIPQEVKR